MKRTWRSALLPADAAARLGAVLLGALALALIVPAIAAADGNSAGDQYVETLPSTKGPKSADDKAGRHRGGLPSRIQKQVQEVPGPTADKLIQIATSPQLGAPEQTLQKDGGKRGTQKGTRGKHRSGGSRSAVPSAAIDAVGGGQAGLGWLVLALLIITALALGAVGYQRFKDRDAAR
jgi:hypothetical protein